MTDYEFVKRIYDDRGSCDGKTGDDCEVCPICKGTCFPECVVYEKAKAWLENYEKENSVDGIKVTVEEKKVEEKAEYPCYKISSNGAIVLFDKPGCGIVIKPGTGWYGEYSYYSDSWPEDIYKPFRGTIKIEVE